MMLTLFLARQAWSVGLAGDVVFDVFEPGWAAEDLAARADHRQYASQFLGEGTLLAVKGRPVRLKTTLCSACCSQGLMVATSKAGSAVAAMGGSPAFGGFQRVSAEASWRVSGNGWFPNVPEPVMD